MAQRTVRGFAWMVFPAPDDVDATEPGRPFPGEASEGGDLPQGVVDFWPIDAELGLEDERTGVSLLVITATPEPPAIRDTYRASPAQLTAGYQAGGGLVRLARVLRTEPSGGDLTLQECEFLAEDDTNLFSAPDDSPHRTGGFPAGADTLGVGGRPGARQAARTDSPSIGPAAGAVSDAPSGAPVGTPMGPRVTGTHNAQQAGLGKSDDPTRSVASPDEIAGEI